LVGVWEGENDITYTFRADGSYKAASKAGKSRDGKWQVTGAEKFKVNVKLTADTGNAVDMTFDTEYALAPGQIVRLDGGRQIIFRRTAADPNAK
jgi:hypothetical protein